MTAQTVKEFVTDAYQIISANSPTVPLHGNDMSRGILFMNELLAFYSAKGLLLTVAKEYDFNIVQGTQEITFGPPDASPVPDVTSGRLANLADIWLELQGVTYPIIIVSRDVFLGSYKYNPQLGLPRFAIVYNDVNLTRVRIYPGASQGYNLHVYGKFEMGPLTENDSTNTLPDYYKRFLKIALAKDLAFYKGRSGAWDVKLEEWYTAAKDEMESVSAVNLVISTSDDSYLNGSWRVMAGI